MTFTAKAWVEQMRVFSLFGSNEEFINISIFDRTVQMELLFIVIPGLCVNIDTRYVLYGPLFPVLQ